MVKIAAYDLARGVHPRVRIPVREHCLGSAAIDKDRALMSIEFCAAFH